MPNKSDDRFTVPEGSFPKPLPRGFHRFGDFGPELRAIYMKESGLGALLDQLANYPINSETAKRTERTMEKQLFAWESWDQHDTMVFGFGEITLVVDIGDHKAGETLPYANINYEHGILELFTDLSKEPEKYQMKLQIIGKL